MAVDIVTSGNEVIIIVLVLHLHCDVDNDVQDCRIANNFIRCMNCNLPSLSKLTQLHLYTGMLKFKKAYLTNNFY